MFNILVPPNQEPQTRRAHKKSRAGCRRCKERKMKCDEAHPICVNCQRRYPTLRTCEYPSAPTTASNTEARTRTLIPATLPESTTFDLEYTSSSEPKRTAAASHSPGNVEAMRPKSPTSGLGYDKDEGGDWKNFLPQTLRGEVLDPFSTLPPSQVAGVDVLLKYYLKTGLYASFPWQPASTTNPTSTYYVPQILSDTVLFHAILQLSAWRLYQMSKDQRSKKGWVIAALHNVHGETIRLLRERIERGSGDGGEVGVGVGKEKNIGVSDQTISAVATLAAIEHERGDLKMMRMHLAGLKRMIHIRGGLPKIRATNPIVANSIFWAFAAALYEVPYPDMGEELPPFLPQQHDLPFSPPIVSVFQDFGPSHGELDLVALGVIPTIAMIVTSIQHVSQLVPTNAAYSSASTSLVILTRTCTLLSHLLSFPCIHMQGTAAGFEAEAESSSVLMSESIRLAALLHVLTPWRGLPPDGTLTIIYLTHQLMATLRSLLSNSVPPATSDTVLLWIFSVGGVAAKMPARGWFVNHLVEMTNEMGIDSWEHMMSHVSRVIWHELLCEKSHRMLWEEVTAKQRELDLGTTSGFDDRRIATELEP